MIRTDTYTAARWSETERAAVERHIPEGHRMTVTHGGRLFHANLIRFDGEVVAREDGLRPEKAAERVLRAASVTVTTDAAGYVEDIA